MKEIIFQRICILPMFMARRSLLQILHSWHSLVEEDMLLGMKAFGPFHLVPFSHNGVRGTAKQSYKARGFSFLHSLAKHNAQVHATEQEVVIALGSNVGDRIGNFDKALSMLKALGIDVRRHGCLYETAPVYITDQPLFLNSAVRGVTRLGPHELLRALKQIEKDMGRKDGIRYGPRPIDLDILFYGKSKIDTEDLKVPHECLFERPFVMAPLVDLLGSSEDTDVVAFWHSFARCGGGLFESWQKMGGESIIGEKDLKRILPVGGTMWNWSKRTLVMGILNLTPDSFSDGGRIHSVEDAISRIREMISEGVDLIDIGAQSTRPKAPRISVNEELERLMHVLEAILQLPEIDGKLLSIDTFYSEVAYAAVNKGVNIVNDVSGGRLDPNMLRLVSELKVPYITMHMRGDPSTMQSSEMVQYEDVCKEVGLELYERVNEAELAGIPAWRIIIDPGIGFSKKCKQNLEILAGLNSIRTELSRMSLAASHMPFLIGPSRKRFLGEVCNRVNPDERDAASVAAVTAGVLGGANIVRVHNVRDNVDAVKVSDALLRHKNACT